MHHFARVASLIGLVFLLTGFAASEISFKSISVAGQSDGAEILAVLGRPDGAGPFPAVVMLPGCGGLNPELRSSWPRVLAEAGYVSIGLENIKSRNMAHCLSRGPAGRPFASWIGDAYAALDHLSRQPYVDVNRVAVAGFSNGGIILSKYMAEDLASPAGHRFKAMISVYAHCNGDTRPGGPPVAGTPRVPWLVINGGAERMEMKGPCGQLKGRTNVTFELIEGAHHGWDMKRFSTPYSDPAGNVMLYSEEATKKSQEIILAFLATHLKK
jgi:dienelactone hydrolase